MKQFKAGRIPKTIWLLASLVSIVLVYILYLALSALLWSPNAKVGNDLLGICISAVLLVLIWGFVIKRGFNEQVKSKEKQVERLTLPLVVENAMLKLMIVGIFCSLLGGLVLVMASVSDDRSIWIALLGLIILLLGLFVVIQRVMSAGKVILRVDEFGITYSPTVFLQQKVTGPIPWSDITDIGIKTVSTGRGSQSYFQVQVTDPTIFQSGKKKGRTPSKLAQFGLSLTQDEQTAISAPLSMLKIKSDALVLTCIEELAKHQMYSADRQTTDILAEQTFVTPNQEMLTTSSDESSSQMSPFELDAASEATRQRRKKIAYLLTGLVFVVIAAIGVLGYLNQQTKYAGLKNKTQYVITTDETTPEILFTFKLFNDGRAKYPVALFATEIGDNVAINEVNVTKMFKVQNQVIQGDKIYNFQKDGNYVASYSKYKVDKGSITLSLDNGIANMIFPGVDFIRVKAMSFDRQAGYFKAQLQLSEAQTSQVIRIYQNDSFSKHLMSK